MTNLEAYTHGYNMGYRIKISEDFFEQEKVIAFIQADDILQMYYDKGMLQGYEDFLGEPTPIDFEPIKLAAA